MPAQATSTAYSTCWSLQPPATAHRSTCSRLRRAIASSVRAACMDGCCSIPYLFGTALHCRHWRAGNARKQLLLQFASSAVQCILPWPGACRCTHEPLRLRCKRLLVNALRGAFHSQSGYSKRASALHAAGFQSLCSDCFVTMLRPAGVPPKLCCTGSRSYRRCYMRQRRHAAAVACHCVAPSPLEGALRARAAVAGPSTSLTLIPFTMLR
jgi:hypothetical protein